jgi:TnpA family transposase
MVTGVDALRAAAVMITVITASSQTTMSWSEPRRASADLTRSRRPGADLARGSSSRLLRSNVPAPSQWWRMASISSSFFIVDRPAMPSSLARSAS